MIRIRTHCLKLQDAQAALAKIVEKKVTLDTQSMPAIPETLDPTALKFTPVN